MKEHSVKSLPGKFLCDKPWMNEIGTNGSLATIFESKMVLNIDNKAVKANPVANLKVNNMKIRAN
jgi:hypothetical protein